MVKKQAVETKERPGGIPHIVGSVIGILLIVVLLPIFVCNMLLIIKSYTKPEKIPSVFGVAPLIVLSGSMRDVIFENDLIFVRQVKVDTLGVGDIIAFQPPGEGKKAVTHRIEEITMEEGRKQFITKGDNNNTRDTDPVEMRDVVGRYFLRLPKVGKVAEFLQTPLGMILCVGIPLAAFLTYDVLRRVLYNRKKQEEDEAAEKAGQADREELERLRLLASVIESGEPVWSAPPAIQDTGPAPEPEAPKSKLNIQYPPVEGEGEA